MNSSAGAEIGAASMAKADGQGAQPQQNRVIIRKSTMIQKNLKRIEEVYKIAKKPIGTGAYGVVSLCQHRETKQERAVKKVPKKKIKNMDRFKQEITIL